MPTAGACNGPCSRLGPRMGTTRPGRRTPRCAAHITLQPPPRELLETAVPNSRAGDELGCAGESCPVHHVSLGMRKLRWSRGTTGTKDIPSARRFGPPRGDLGRAKAKKRRGRGSTARDRVDARASEAHRRYRAGRAAHEHAADSRGVQRGRWGMHDPVGRCALLPAVVGADATKAMRARRRGRTSRVSMPCPL
jgi:hypothetical protein